MNDKRHESRPPEIGKLLALLHRKGVRFVLAGSTAAMVYGAELTPRDLDIVPATDRANLEKLSSILVEIEAQLDLERFGHWEMQEDCERKWIEDEPTDELRNAAQNWRRIRTGRKATTTFFLHG